MISALLVLKINQKFRLLYSCVAKYHRCMTLKTALRLNFHHPARKNVFSPMEGGLSTCQATWKQLTKNHRYVHILLIFHPQVKPFFLAISFKVWLFMHRLGKRKTIMELQEKVNKVAESLLMLVVLCWNLRKVGKSFLLRRVIMSTFCTVQMF